MRTVSVFGSTGSVGQTTLNVVAQDPDAYQVEVLSGHKNVALLAKQINTFGPKIAVVSDEAAAKELAKAVDTSRTEILFGQDGLRNAASEPVGVMMSAIVGFAGLEVSMLGAQHASLLALANKESLVCAGPLLRRACEYHGTKLVPVDSEHSAIYQCLRGERLSDVERILLTASGGPFLHMSTEQMSRATPQMAADHPNWDMGQRISIDSASLFNKAMEVIEAKELFDLEPDQIEVVVHPQSIVHSMVGYTDRSIIAQLGPPDMTGAIGFALNYPDRRPLPQERLDFAKLSRLDFQPLDSSRFPAVGLAHKAMKTGELAGAVFNAAKEKALDCFISETIGFLDMAVLVEKALQHYDVLADKLDLTLDSVAEIDARTRKYISRVAAEEALYV